MLEFQPNLSQLNIPETMCLEETQSLVLGGCCIVLKIVMDLMSDTFAHFGHGFS
jgi:hypothetical protein